MHSYIYIYIYIYAYIHITLQPSPGAAAAAELPLRGGQRAAGGRAGLARPPEKEGVVRQAVVTQLRNW